MKNMFLYAFVFIILIANQSVSAQLSTTTESSKCGEGEFRCRNGACIPGASRCNGTTECPDKSDEIFALCRNYTCQVDQFTCTYGACIPRSVICDGKRDCADNSDEISPLCRNDFTDINVCEERFIDGSREWSRSVDCMNQHQTCDNGQLLQKPSSRCDGHVDCDDGSDETLASCVNTECRPPLFRCAYGGCAYPKAQCDDVEDCADGSDESYELCGRILPAKTTTTPNEAEFRCRNGASVPGASRCNGTTECPDKSDEIFALCRNNTCQEDEFRCTYGACMPMSVRCDDKQDCADNSDELVPLCRNDFTDFNICEERLIDERQWSRAIDCTNLRQTCDNGQVLQEPTRCDGRGLLGGKVKRHVEDCADGSDESYELCGRILPAKTTTTPKPVCTLPPQPDHGSYKMGGKVQGVPGQQFNSFVLKFSCDPPYGIVGESTLFCSMGEWFGELPKCAHFCQLHKHHSVEYRCPLLFDATVEGTRECNEREPAGTTVKPRCRLPVYYYPGLMLNMHCNESGRWDQIVTCIPECGKLGSAANALLLQGREAMRSELPWHVAVYRRPHLEQVCAGTVVRTNVVISAAHCFWIGSSLQPVSNYVVAAGKLYRTWNHPSDVNTTQTSEIREIIVPGRFQGSATNFQNDIAVLILISNLQYTSHVRPVCIDFDYAFDSRQLKVLSVGKIAGWGQTERGSYSETLRVADVPYVSIQDCIADTPEGFKAYITSDKICAGYKNGTALCKGDSGGGLTFPARERSTYRYYLRGVASTGFNNELCNSATMTSFTRVVTHEQFLQEYL